MDLYFWKWYPKESWKRRPVVYPNSFSCFEKVLPPNPAKCEKVNDQLAGFKIRFYQFIWENQQPRKLFYLLKKNVTKWDFLSNFMAFKTLMLFIRALKSHFLRISYWAVLSSAMFKYDVISCQSVGKFETRGNIFALPRTTSFCSKNYSTKIRRQKYTDTTERPTVYLLTWRPNLDRKQNSTCSTNRQTLETETIEQNKKNSVLYSFSRLSNVFSHFCGLNLSRNHNEKYRTMKPSSRHFRNLGSSYVMYSNLYCTRASLNLFFVFHFWCFLAKTRYLRICIVCYPWLNMFSFEIIREVCTNACFFFLRSFTRVLQVLVARH